MEFEDILASVGDFGRYQKTLVMVFLIPALTVIPWFSLNMIFLTSTPDHWCNVPQVTSKNLTLNIQKYLIRPKQDPTCSMYDINYIQFLDSSNWTIDENWPTRPCSEGWQYDVTDYYETATTRWNMVCADNHYTSLVMSLIFVGDVIGTPFYGAMSDRIGRKPTFFFLALVTATAEIASVFVPNFIAYLVLKVINGSTMSTIYQVSYIILLELVGPTMRTRMNGVSTTSWTLGLCLLPLIAYLTRHWVKMSLVTSSMGLAFFIYWRFLPESPRWLVSQGRYEEAAAIMTTISKRNGKSAHEGNELLHRLQKLGENMQKEKMNTSTYSPLDFVRYPQLRKTFLLVTFCWIANSMTYFGLQINVTKLAGSEFLNFFLISLVEVPSHLCTWLFMERLGRRWCSVSAFLLTGIACLLPSLCPDDIQLIGVISSLLGKIGASSAFMTLYQQAPELFPTPMRGMGMGLGSTIATVTTLTAPYVVYLAEYGKFIPFVVFSGISILGAMCAAFLPETLNEKLPQTIADAESFGINQKFFSCSKEQRTMSIDTQVIPAAAREGEITTDAISREEINGNLEKRNSIQRSPKLQIFVVSS